MKRPNVVFVIADQHRWDFMGYETNGVTVTPNLEKLGEGGVVFRSAYCTSPLCSPSRAAIALGRYGIHSGCFTNLHQPPPGSPTFVNQLRRHGYRTAAFGKTHMEIHAYDADYTSEEHRAYMDSLGWDEVCDVAGGGMIRTGIRCSYSEWLREQGMFREVVDFYRQWGYFMDAGRKALGEFDCREWPFEARFRNDHFIAERAMGWLREHGRGGPFFLHVGFIGPHSPVEPLPQYMDLYRDREEPPPRGVDAWKPGLPDGRRGYRAWITELDDYVGRIRALLGELGLVDDTVFIYTADHGEMAGDFGLTGKTCFFEGSVRVPLIFAGPGVRGGRRSGTFVSLVDLGGTVCELCGVATHERDEGQSLVGVLSGGRETHRDTLYVEMGCDRMIRDGRWKLMWGDPLRDTRKLGRLHLDKPVNIPPSPPRLYDLREDPHELRDLARDDASREIIEALLAQLGPRTLEEVTAQPNQSRGEYRPL